MEKELDVEKTSKKPQSPPTSKVMTEEKQVDKMEETLQGNFLSYI